ncbi:DUF1877 family protein [Streptomyces sp. NPDC056402]|uniref:DUF1877 family protein n=1 Tax=Streptomyces sp. NPDC056402 TaxID=3345810 RepID=UPI0035DDEB7F
MGARGVLFALDELEAERILACRGDDEIIAVVEEVEEVWDRDHLFELDKSWDALHRCFTDGDLAFENGEYPLSHVILGGRLLHEGDYIVCYVAPDQVREVAAALEPLDEQWLSNRFVTLTFDSYQGSRTSTARRRRTVARPSSPSTNRLGPPHSPDGDSGSVSGRAGRRAAAPPGGVEAGHGDGDRRQRLRCRAAQHQGRARGEHGEEDDQILTALGGIGH